MDTPASLDWLVQLRPAVVAAVADGIRIHVEALRAQGVDFYGYSLHPGEPDDIYSLAAVSNTEADIQCPRDDDDYPYYRYSVDEWARWDTDGFTAANALLEKANKRLKSMASKMDDDDDADDFSCAHAELLLDYILEGMAAAKSAGVFGKSKPFLVIWISDSDEEIMVRSARRLNSRAVAKVFVEQFGE